MNSLSLNSRATKLFLIGSFLFSSATSIAETHSEGIAVVDYSKLHCEQPKFFVRVKDFECSAPACQKTADAGQPAGGLGGLLAGLAAQSGNMPRSADLTGLGDGLTAMYLSALQKSGCFSVQSFSTIKKLKEEAELLGEKFELPPVDYSISGSITSASYQKETKKQGIAIPIVGHIKKTTEFAELTLVLEITDKKTNVISAMETFTGNSQSSEKSLHGSGFRDMQNYGGMGGVKGTPLEEIAKDVMGRAVEFSYNKLLPPASSPSEQPASSESSANEVSAAQ